MNTTNVLRTVDLSGQLLMLLPLTGGLSFENIILAYYTVGGWQLISHCVNWYRNPAGRPRRVGYARVLRILILIAVTLIPLAIAGVWFGERSSGGDAVALGSAGVLILFLYSMLLLGPVLAIWYFFLCIRELRDAQAAAMHRREIHWKL